MVQEEQLRLQFNKQHIISEDKDEDDDSVPCPQKSRFNHRRATTNLVQPHPALASTRGQLIGYKDDIGLVEERDKLISYITHYVQLRKEIPVTSLDYYKFMKLIGKGAFGKVTLGIHKLSGKHVAIKTVDKSLMKDDYQRKKVLQEVLRVL